MTNVTDVSTLTKLTAVAKVRNRTGRTISRMQYTLDTQTQCREKMSEGRGTWAWEHKDWQHTSRLEYIG